jgi:GAF domain-containing protein
MTAPTPEARIASAFLRASDSLAGGDDMMTRMQVLVEDCTAIFGVEAAGVMLADAQGHLQLFASTSVRLNLVELQQLNVGAGPCLQAFETGAVVPVADIGSSADSWPGFRAGALQQGYRAVHAIPMRVRDTVIGTLSLWSTEPGELPAPAAAIAEALAQVATVGILNERAVRQQTGVAEQLQHALDNRILVEQAKGVLSHTWSLEMDAAYEVMRQYARSRSMPVHALAASILDGSLDVAVILSAASVPVAKR